MNAACVRTRASFRQRRSGVSSVFLIKRSLAFGRTEFRIPARKSPSRITNRCSTRVKPNISVNAKIGLLYEQNRFSRTNVDTVERTLFISFHVYHFAVAIAVRVTSTHIITRTYALLIRNCRRRRIILLFIVRRVLFGHRRADDLIEPLLTIIVPSFRTRAVISPPRSLNINRANIPPIFSVPS